LSSEKKKSVKIVGRAEVGETCRAPAVKEATHARRRIGRPRKATEEGTPQKGTGTSVDVLHLFDTGSSVLKK
jgi:hypothetical protein